MFSLPENLKVIEALAPQVGAAAAVTGDYISVKNYHKVYGVIHYAQGDATDITWAWLRATAVAPTGSAAVANVCRIWSDLDCATSDLLVERTAAINYASGAGLTHKLIVVEFDCADLGAGYDVIALSSTTAIAATSYVSMMYYGVPRVASRVLTQPSGIID